MANYVPVKGCLANEIAFEWCDGTNLDLNNFDGKSEPAVVVFILHELAKVLAYVHERGYVHGDVKPENIMFDPVTKRPRLVDFGFCLPKSTNYPKSGTPYYMSPVFLGHYTNNTYFTPKVTFEDDIWAFGVTAHELFFGTVPFGGNNLDELRQLAEGGLSSQQKEEIQNESLDDFSLCLAVDPRKRPTASTLVGSLAELLPKPV
jgi:serine/threonine protein kinase